MSQDNEGREDDAEAPLSAESQAVLDRARRRAGFSLVLMLMGFMAIVVAVVYRLSTMSDTPAAQYALEAIALPPGAQIVHTQLEAGLVSVTYRLEDTQAIRVFEGSDGTLVREITVVAE